MERNVVRFCDYERRSREPDEHPLRDLSQSAMIIILPVVKIENYEETDPPPRRRRRPF